MRYKKTVKAQFLSRSNRFIAQVLLEGQEQTVHVKNTGRCRELLLPGVTVVLEDFRGRPEAAQRKTLFDLIAVYKIYPEDPKRPPLLINMDSQAPNKVVKEWLETQSFHTIKGEYTFGNSRLDFYMEKEKQPFLLEVKGCTLEKNGVGYFPDAPTLRGVKHIKELEAALTQGFRSYVAFVIQMEGVYQVFPNEMTHPEFGEALKEAQNSGVEILYLPCEVKEDEIKISFSNKKIFNIE